VKVAASGNNRKNHINKGNGAKRNIAAKYTVLLIFVFIVNLCVVYNCLGLFGLASQ
jgi:hypothetical protein